MLLLGGVAEIADHDADGTRSKLGDGLGTIRRSGVQHHLVAVMKKRLRRCPPEPVRAAGNEDDRHPLLLTLFRSGLKKTQRPCDHFRYCSSLTFSIQSTFLPLTDS